MYYKFINRYYSKLKLKKVYFNSRIAPFCIPHLNKIKEIEKISQTRYNLLQRKFNKYYGLKNFSKYYWNNKLHQRYKPY
jgi:hypothetical protein